MGKWIKKVTETPLNAVAKVVNSLNGSSYFNAPSINAVNNGLAGKANTNHSHSIDDISDIELDEVADGDALVYDATEQKFVNQAIEVEGMVDRTFNVPVSSWVANTGSTSTDYPYIAEISSEVYTADSKPIWQMGGAGDIPTSAEREDINLVLEAWFDTTGITLYATDVPSGALVLEVKGE